MPNLESQVREHRPNLGFPDTTRSPKFKLRHYPSRGLLEAIGSMSEHVRESPPRLEGPASGFLLAALRKRCFSRSLGLGPRMRQRHAAEGIALVEVVARPFRASLSRDCGQL